MKRGARIVFKGGFSKTATSGGTGSANKNADLLHRPKQANERKWTR